MDAREKILDTAARLFATKGFGSTSLSQVAKEADVSKALIFWHFESKEKLFRSALQRSLEPYFINVVDALEGLDQLQQVLKLIDLFYDFTRDNMQSIRFVLSLILREEKQPDDAVARLAELLRLYRELLSEILESGRRKGAFRPDLDARSEAGLVVASLSGALVLGFLGEGSEGAAEVLDHLKASLAERLRTTGPPEAA